jgi:hypothetical protein
MPFSYYASIADVARAHQIKCLRKEFKPPAPVQVSEYFQSELELTLTEMPFDASDESIREMLIFPVLREIWKPFRETLMLWSRPSIVHDEDLSGTPAYVVARNSPLGRFIFEPPCHLVVIQARKDDFVRAWGECLATLVALRKINGQCEKEVFGVVTNGTAWECGRLGDNDFVQDRRPFVLSGLGRLVGALHAVLLECQDQAAPQPHIV